MLLLWIGTSGLLVVSRGDPETYLRTRFATDSRPDTLDDFNRTMAYFWVVHSCLTLIALSATRSRRPDVLVVLLIGPALADFEAALRLGPPDREMYLEMLRGAEAARRNLVR